MPSSRKNTDSRERMLRYLRQHNMRSTPERLGIIDAVSARTGVFTAEDIHSDIGMISFPVSLATVYNTMNLLVDAGILRCVRLPEHPSRFYEVTGENASQAYYICRRCGSCRKYRGSGLTARIRQHDFGELSPDYFIINIYGLCRKCRKVVK